MGVDPNAHSSYPYSLLQNLNHSIAPCSAEAMNLSLLTLIISAAENNLRGDERLSTNPQVLYLVNQRIAF